jgi:ferredoxin
MGKQKMKIQSVKACFFSPTGTTKAVVQAIVRGIQHTTSEFIDITNPDSRKQHVLAAEDELLIVAVPVYVGRVPALLNQWLHAIKARKAPTVCLVVYGNRDYENALIELKDKMIQNGGIPIACAAYIGEHSFSGPDTPIALSRPDAEDLKHAEAFGRRINEMLLSATHMDLTSEIHVPGKVPSQNPAPLLSVDFINISHHCSGCGACAKACPAGAIDLKAYSITDKEKCILCCACIKICPEKARTMKNGTIKDIAIRLSESCKDRKEPELFFNEK